MLAFFLLSIFAAFASPIVDPQSLHVICTGQGPAMVVEVDDEGEHVPSRRQAESGPFLKIPAALPAADGTRPMARAFARAEPWLSVPANPVTAIDGAPLPARGPPAAAIL